MSAYKTDQVRIKFDVNTHEPGKNILNTSGGAEIWKGVDAVIDVTAFAGDTVCDASAWSAVILLLFAYEDYSAALDTFTGTKDATVTEATWLDGTKQHARFTLSNTDTDIELGGASKQFTCVVYGETTDSPAKKFVLGKFALTIAAAGVPAA